jgi:hypothetical protein
VRELTSVHLIDIVLVVIADGGMDDEFELAVRGVVTMQWSKPEFP